MFRRRPATQSADRSADPSADRAVSGGSRRSVTSPGGDGDTGTSGTSTGSTMRGGRKGRPTPKRREAERERRKRVRAPRDRKEAYRQTRARARDERLRMRRALSTGDERNLPPRDAGPVKSFARDYVDSRRRAGELFLPGAIVVFVLTLVPSPQVQSVGFLVWFLLILLVIVDSFRVVVGVRREAAERFPRQPTRGLGSYVVLRSLQVRRFRLPPPKVKPGTKI